MTDSTRAVAWWTEGSWTGVVTSRAMMLLPPKVPQEVTERLWQLLRSNEASLTQALDELVTGMGGRLSAVPDFVLAVTEPGDMLHVALRGAAHLEVDGQAVDASSVTTWLETVFRSPGTVVASAPERPGTVRRPVADAVVVASSLALGGERDRESGGSRGASGQAAASSAEQEEDAEPEPAPNPFLQGAAGEAEGAVDRDPGRDGGEEPLLRAQEGQEVPEVVDTAEPAPVDAEPAPVDAVPPVVPDTAFSERGRPVSRRAPSAGSAEPADLTSITDITSVTDITDVPERAGATEAGQDVDGTGGTGGTGGSGLSVPPGEAPAEPEHVLARAAAGPSTPAVVQALGEAAEDVGDESGDASGGVTPDLGGGREPEGHDGLGGVSGAGDESGDGAGDGAGTVGLRASADQPREPGGVPARRSTGRHIWEPTVVDGGLGPVTAPSPDAPSPAVSSEAGPAESAGHVSLVAVPSHVGGRREPGPYEDAAPASQLEGGAGADVVARAPSADVAGDHDGHTITSLPEDLSEELRAELLGQGLTPDEPAAQTARDEGLVAAAAGDPLVEPAGTRRRAGPRVAGAARVAPRGDHDGHTVSGLPEDLVGELVSLVGRTPDLSRTPVSAPEALAATPGTPGAPASSDVPPVRVVLSAVCGEGHPNPTNYTTCRVCGADLNRPAKSVACPPLGRLVTSSGQVVDLDRPVLVGRSPVPADVTSSSDVPIRSLVVPSPNQLVSRNHVLIDLDAWSVLAQDLGNCNGTVLNRAGETPVRLASSSPVLLRSGDVLDVGDGQILSFENLP